MKNVVTTFVIYFTAAILNRPTFEKSCVKKNNLFRAFEFYDSNSGPISDDAGKTETAVLELNYYAGLK